MHHPIFDHPSVSLTPHLMGLTRKATAATFADAARGVVDVLERPPTVSCGEPGLGRGVTDPATTHPPRTPCGAAAPRLITTPERANR